MTTVAAQNLALATRQAKALSANVAIVSVALIIPSEDPGPR